VPHREPSTLDSRILVLQHADAPGGVAWQWSGRSERPTIIGVPSLLEVITHLHDISAGDGISPGPTIYARLPWTPQSDAVVLRGDEVPDGVVTESGHQYLLEVDLAIEAVEVWSAWRDGATPTPEEATLAVIHYGENDAYQPVDREL